MKRELEKLAGPMLIEAERVKLEVNRKVSGKPNGRTRNIWPQIAGVGAVIVAVILAIIFYRDLLPLEDEIVSTVPEHIVPLSEELFEMRVYETRYLRGRFIEEAYAKKMAFQDLYESLALVSYLHYRGAKLSDEEEVAFQESIDLFIAEFDADKSLEKHYKPLLDKFSITLENYLTMEFYLEQYLDVLANKSDVMNEMDVRTKAKQYYYPFVEGEVRRFEAKYGFEFDIDESYWSVLEADMGELITERLDFLFDNTIEHFGVRLDEEGEYVFVNPSYTSFMIYSTYWEIMDEIQARIEGEPGWGPLAYAEYKRVAEQLANNRSEVFDDARALLEIFELLERSFAGEYDF